jgi:hypothetical protein
MVEEERQLALAVKMLDGRGGLGWDRGSRRSRPVAQAAGDQRC